MVARLGYVDGCAAWMFLMVALLGYVLMVARLGYVLMVARL